MTSKRRRKPKQYPRSFEVLRHSASPYRLEFKIYGNPPRMNTADFRNWRILNAEKKLWYRLVAAVTVGVRPTRPLSRARVTISRFTSATRGPDFENLTQGGKHVLDGLVKADIIEDDNPGVIGQPTYTWSQIDRKSTPAIKVWVEGIPDDTGPRGREGT